MPLAGAKGLGPTIQLYVHHSAKDRILVDSQIYMTWWDSKRTGLYADDLSKNKSLFVVDEPSDEDEFGYDHYINALEALVRECKTPFVVGVLGKWGVGKTTLINKFLKARIKATKTIGFVYFDAWKYQKNAFYRQFLRKMRDDLEIQDDSLFVRFYQTIQRTRETGDLEVNREEVKNLIFEIVAWYVGWYIFAIQFGLEPLSFVGLLLPLLPAVILGFVRRFPKLVRVKTLEEEDKPLFSNEQFEDVFKYYVDKAKESGLQRIVVVVDNLDRCTNEVAVELLGTIKTFLNVEDCVYVVPVDEEALINHLKEGLLNSKLDPSEQDKQSREFLKKFFQATIRLSPFIRGDLEKYIDKIAKSVAIPYANDTERENVANLVLTAYSHTPRKIKQFYNNLSASFLLALAQEEQGNIDKDSITKNLSCLAKLIILQEEWPSFFKYIKDDPELLGVAEAHLRGREMDKDTPHRATILKELEKEGLSDFLQISRPYTSTNLGQFINLKREGYGGFESVDSELVINLLTGRFEPAVSILKEGTDEEKNSLIKLLEDQLAEKSNQGKQAAVLNLLTDIAYIFPAIPEDKKKKVADFFASRLAHAARLENVKELPPSNLVDLLGSATQKENRDIILLKQSESFEQDIELFIECSEAYGQNLKIIPANARKNFAHALYKAYVYEDEKVSYIPDVLESIKKLAKYDGAIKAYSAEELKDTIVDKVAQIRPEALQPLEEQNLEVLREVGPYLKDSLFTKLLATIHRILHSESGWGTGKEKLAEFINEMVVAGVVPKTLLQEVGNHYADYINSSNITPGYHVNFIPAIKRLVGESPEAKQVITDKLKHLAQTLDLERLSILFKEIDAQKVGVREKLVPPLVDRLSGTSDKGQRGLIFDLLKLFGALQNGQLYTDALKDALIKANDFEITNHIIAQLEEVRPSITKKEMTEMLPKLLEWGTALGHDHPRRNRPYSFIIPSFSLFNEDEKAQIIDAFIAILESGAPTARKNEICSHLQSDTVVDNFPASRRDDLLRKVFDLAQAAGPEDKEILLNTLIALKPLYSRKTTFIAELKAYGKELSKHTEGTREHQIGTDFLKKLSA